METPGHLLTKASPKSNDEECAAPYAAGKDAVEVVRSRNADPKSMSSFGSRCTQFGRKAVNNAQITVRMEQTPINSRDPFRVAVAGEALYLSSLTGRVSVIRYCSSRW
jgi:hypothetical protein